MNHLTENYDIAVVGADLVTFLDSKMLAINEEVRSIREENKE